MAQPYINKNSNNDQQIVNQAYPFNPQLPNGKQKPDKLHRIRSDTKHQVYNSYKESKLKRTIKSNLYEVVEVTEHIKQPHLFPWRNKSSNILFHYKYITNRYINKFNYQ